MDSKELILQYDEVQYKNENYSKLIESISKLNEILNEISKIDYEMMFKLLSERKKEEER